MSTKICPKCNENHNKEGRFCSRGCANSRDFSNRKRPPKSCLFCNKQFHSWSHDASYCSVQCRKDYMFTCVQKPNVEAGVATHSTTLKKYLKTVRGDVCECCGLSNEWNGKPLSLQLDHIDGNSDNNFPNNIRLLCPNCHTQTETFCSRNIKNSKRRLYARQYRKRVTDLVNPS